MLATCRQTNEKNLSSTDRWNTDINTNTNRQTAHQYSETGQLTCTVAKRILAQGRSPLLRRKRPSLPTCSGSEDNLSKLRTENHKLISQQQKE